jgi:hypothetical protein
MPSVHEKLAWLEAITQSAQRFVDGGGELKSIEAAPLGLALFHAMNDLAGEFGFQSSKPVDVERRKHQDAAPRLV